MDAAGSDGSMQPMHHLPKPLIVAWMSALTLLAVVGCRMRGDDLVAAQSSATAPGSAPVMHRPVPAARPVAAPVATAPVVPVPAPQGIDREPVIGLLLTQAREVRFSLLVSARLADGRTLPAGPVSVLAEGAGVRISGLGVVPSGSELTPQGPPPTFSTTVGVPGFKAQALNGSGAIALVRSGADVLLIERLGLEQYLLCVLPVEMNPNWPLEALKAQAVAARTYSAARYVERLHQPWQLHWHFTVDMAYGGWRAPSSKVATAVAQTRGDLLLWHNLPFEALFHASSGGRTELATRVKPDLRGPDGSQLGAVMGVVDDPSCEGGARGLNLSASHWRWKADLPLAAVGPSLLAWGRDRARPAIAFGAVESISIGGRYPDSGRVATVQVRHRLGKRQVTTTMSGQDFRMAVGPGKLRSTWWDRCTMAGPKADVLVIEGRGFGHGVGLSQISAWKMAGEHATAAEILARFYPGATLLKKY